VVLVFS